MTENEKLIAGIKNRGTEIAKKSGRLKFGRCKDAHARISELENELGLPPGAPIWNLFQVNQRVFELEALARKPGTPANGLHGRQLAVAATKIKGLPGKATRNDLSGRDRMKATMSIEGQRNS